MGGVIAEEAYTGVHLPSFQVDNPVLELLHGYDWQVALLHNHEDHCGEQNVELMPIDACLSYVGRTGEIINGPNEPAPEDPCACTRF